MSLASLRRVSRPGWWLLGCGIAFEAALVGLAVVGNLSQQAGAYVITMAGLFGLFGLASLKVLKAPTASPLSDQSLLVIICYFAVLFRLTALVIAPSLSTDEFRYIWEGRLVTQGVSPYQYAPVDPALAPYVAGSEIWPLVQQRETASPYPPLNQVIGAVAYLLFGESLLGPKITAVFFDLLTCLALLWLLQIYRLDLKRVILYAWCPLPVIEFGQSGHNDAPMLCLLLLSIGLAMRRQPALSAAVLGLACLAKFTPLFGLPVFLAVWYSGKNWSLREFVFRPRNWRYPALTLAIVVAGYGPFLILGGGAIGSIFEYTGSWIDNEAPFYSFFYYRLSLTVAKVASLVVLGLILLVLSFEPRVVARLSLPRRLMLALGVTLLVASTVHVWYLTWLLVLLPLVYHTEASPFFKWWDWAWLSFSLLIQLSYLTYGGTLTHYEWIRPVEYLPLHLLLGYGLYRWWQEHTRQRLNGSEQDEQERKERAGYAEKSL